MVGDGAEAGCASVIWVCAETMPVTVILEFFFWFCDVVVVVIGWNWCLLLIVDQLVDQFGQHVDLLFVSRCLVDHLLDGLVGFGCCVVYLFDKRFHLCCKIGLVKSCISCSVANIVLMFIPCNVEAALEFCIRLLIRWQAVKFSNVDVKNACFLNRLLTL